MAATFLIVSIACNSAPQTSTAPRPPRGAAPSSRTESTPLVVDLRLEALEQARHSSKIGRIDRNLFSFGGRVVESDAGGAAPRVVFPPVTPGNIPTAPSLPPIALRYIGLLEVPSQAGRVAILTDGRGNIFYGREGDTIEGRYLVVQVSATTTELSYLDGRGRQTVRLSGQ
jgi:hypothetical protein